LTDKIPKGILSVNLALSLIHHVPNCSENERKDIELNFRKNAFKRYGNRLYNPPGQKELMQQQINIQRKQGFIRPTVERARDIENSVLPKIFTFPVIIDNQWYNNFYEAVRLSNMGFSASRLKRNALSPNFPNIIWEIRRYMSEK